MNPRIGVPRRLAPWEKARKLARNQYKLPVDGRKHGRRLMIKRVNNIIKADRATFCCPECRNDVRVDLIRIRPDFYDCRRCGHKFVKTGIVDDFDYDYER